MMINNIKVEELPIIKNNILYILSEDYIDDKVKKFYLGLYEKSDTHKLYHPTFENFWLDHCVKEIDLDDIAFVIDNCTHIEKTRICYHMTPHQVDPDYDVVLGNYVEIKNLIDKYQNDIKNTPTTVDDRKQIIMAWLKEDGIDDKTISENIDKIYEKMFEL